MAICALDSGLSSPERCLRLRRLSLALLPHPPVKCFTLHFKNMHPLAFSQPYDSYDLFILFKANALIIYFGSCVNSNIAIMPRFVYYSCYFRFIGWITANKTEFAGVLIEPFIDFIARRMNTVFIDVYRNS